jgi:hypothetical protein
MRLSTSQPVAVTITAPPMLTRWWPMQAFGSKVHTMPGCKHGLPHTHGIGAGETHIELCLLPVDRGAARVDSGRSPTIEVQTFHRWK